MKAGKSIQGLEQLIYHRYSSLNSAAGGHILDRTRTGAHKIMRNLAHTHLSSSDLDLDSDRCFIPESNDYWDSDLECEEYDPALWQDLAVVALKYYHEKQGVELEVNGKICASPLHYGGGIGFHLDFQANDTTGSLNKIFAEVFLSEKNGECRVLFCDIMDPNDPDLLKGCRFCSPLVLHPKGIKFFKASVEWSDA
ncbi:uncharacterized protein LOC141637808 isoform X2 [Silene latifolia]|uniref:uncharacterized protein LOC141637808 isoform X2 n=1 Tax=Silene latifolia TaxID=37657 RepID=UPI003D771919